MLNIVDIVCLALILSMLLLTIAVFIGDLYEDTGEACPIISGMLTGAFLAILIYFITETTFIG